jgi:peroxiredoxin
MNKKILRLIVFAVIIGMFVFLGLGLKENTSAVDVGDPGFDFELEDMDGKLHKLSDYRGQVVVLNYFTSWCDPCIEEVDILQAFEENYNDKAKLLIIDRGETKKNVKEFIDKYQTTSTYLFDYNLKVSKKYNVIAQPETFIIDKEGMIREHIIGPVQLYGLEELVKKYE